jgi:hypothetical protein
MNPDFLQVGVLAERPDIKPLSAKEDLTPWVTFKTSFLFIPKSQAIRIGVLVVL